MARAPRSKAGKRRKKVVRKISLAVAHVKSTFNNTIIAITDHEGNVIVCGSAGITGFKGAKKSTPFAAQIAAADVAKRAKEVGIKEVIVRVKGPGPGREAAIRSLQGAGLSVRSVKDVTPIPHNGCRPRKRRRV